jgi:fructokinase
VALTLGERGAWLLSRNQQFHQAARQGMQVVDTVGAGDNFAAALLAYLYHEGALKRDALHGASKHVLQAALAHAVAAAAMSVQRVGSDPASWGETVQTGQLLLKR